MFTKRYDASQRTEKATDASPPSYPQSATGNRSPPLVSKQRVLRSRRLASGQVRDVAGGPRRQKFYSQGCACFWLLSSLLLPGTVGLSAGRSLRSVSPQTRPPSWTQTNRRSDEVCYSTASRRSFSQS